MAIQLLRLLFLEIAFLTAIPTARLQQRAMETKVPDSGGLSSHVELKDKVSVKGVPGGPIDGLSTKEYNRILRKVDYRVIPILASLYLLSFLDRGEKHIFCILSNYC